MIGEGHEHGAPSEYARLMPTSAANSGKLAKTLGDEPTKCAKHVKPRRHPSRSAPPILRDGGALFFFRSLQPLKKSVILTHMKLVFALGNAERRYADTRHNIGFACLDSYAEQHGTTWQRKEKFKADIAELTVNHEKIIIAKPTTYYNLVGDSARAIMDFYKLEPADILILHDDLALPFGTIRTRLGGSGGGNNGIKSLNATLGENTVRIRIGINNDLAEHIDAADFVLARFTPAEQESLPSICQKSTNLIDNFIAGSLDLTTHR